MALAERRKIEITPEIEKKLIQRCEVNPGGTTLRELYGTLYESWKCACFQRPPTPAELSKIVGWHTQRILTAARCFDRRSMTPELAAKIKRVTDAVRKNYRVNVCEAGGDDFFQHFNDEPDADDRTTEEARSKKEFASTYPADFDECARLITGWLVKSYGKAKEDEKKNLVSFGDQLALDPKTLHLKLSAASGWIGSREIIGAKNIERVT